MHDSDATGGGVVTDWATLGVDQMWRMLADHTEGPGWAQSAGWHHTFELLDYHQSRVQEYRDRLAERWPPEGSPAAAEFLGKVDEMLASLRVMRDAALSNGPALAHLNASLAEARTKLEPVHQQWAANEAKLAAYRQTTTSSNGTPMPSPGVPPVPASQQNQLHAQAVAIMSTLATHTVETQRAIRTPPSYQPPQPTEDIVATDDPVPPPSARRADRRVSPVSPTRPAPTSPTDASRDGGPSLAGVNSHSGTVPVPPLSRQPSPSPASSTGGGMLGFGPSGIGLGRPSPSAGYRDGTSERMGQAIRANPRGGVIGPSPNIEEQQPRRTGNPRANPIGGVIGPQTGQESGLVTGPMGGGRIGENRRRHRNPAYDSADDWPLRTGVPPVLMPGDEPVHDPGPILGPRP